mgnify:CR=1 FL=1
MALYSDLPPVSVGGRKYVGRVVFAFMMLLAAAALFATAVKLLDRGTGIRD